MKEDKWIHDIQAGELVNLKDCRAIWIEEDLEETEEFPARFSLQFTYYKDKSDYYLHYESSELLRNAFEHYKELLGCVELDVSKKSLKL